MVQTYLIYVFSKVCRNQKNINEFIDEGYLQLAVNDWETGPHSFVKWIEATKRTTANVIDGPAGLCEMVIWCNKRYASNYGEYAIIDWKKLSWAFVLHHYAYCYAHFELNSDSLKLLLLPTAYSSHLLHSCDACGKKSSHKQNGQYLCDTCDNFSEESETELDK
jgi:hypothetical protein